MKFYTFNQNNSGGGFIYDESSGISHWVIIEAENTLKANQKALDIGLYFNGCETDQDCPCCGDRWHEVDESDGSATPTIYGKPASQHNENKWINGYEIFVHHANGKIEGLFK